MRTKGCIIGGFLCIAVVVLSVRWWTAPIDLPRPQRPREPADNPYEVYRSLAHYSSQLFRNDARLAEAERTSMLTRSQIRQDHPELVYYLLLKTYPVRSEYRKHLRKPCVATLEYTPRWTYAELREFRRWAHLEALNMAEASARGDYASAVDSFRTILLLSEQIQTEGRLIHRLTAHYMQSVVATQMAKRVSELPEPACRELVQAVREWYARRVPLERTVAVERDALLHLLHLLQESDPDALQTLRQVERPIPWPPRWLNLRQAAREADRYYRRVRQEISKPLNLQQPAEVPDHPLVRSLVIVFIPASLVCASNTARIQMLGCAAAVRAYRLRHGRYPPDLQTAGVADLDVDPFTGARFIYKRGNNGFLLYSVGRDGQDDGGWLTAEQYSEQGDLSILPYRPPAAKRQQKGSPIWLR